ncbi:hypothetical protein DL767_004387 [Monosporascus sp. MG133]|nr:hypothetical protein DL767_004387 [Monosporascus sp. MG133]
MDATGTDTTLYKLKGIVTSTRFFSAADGLRGAYEAGELKEDYYQPEDDSWAMSLEVGVKRYKLDSEHKYVEYMGCSSYVAHTRPQGVMFYDIRFKGEPTLYGLSMQEAAAQYGGFQPKAARTLYPDTYYSLGANLYQLTEGFNCPFSSTFWDIPIHEGSKTTTNPSTICIFESDAGFALSRHRVSGGPSDYGFQNFCVVKASLLTLGSIAAASRYLQSSFYFPAQWNWGPRIQAATQGSLHDYVVTFKADFDILDVYNSLQVSELKAVPTSQPW